MLQEIQKMALYGSTETEKAQCALWTTESHEFFFFNEILEQYIKRQHHRALTFVNDMKITSLERSIRT